MTFTEAYKEMQNGKKVRRHGFHGYCYINPETGIFTTHLSQIDPKTKVTVEKDITYGKLDLTIKNVVHDDWEVVEEPETK